MDELAPVCGGGRGESVDACGSAPRGLRPRFPVPRPRVGVGVDGVLGVIMNGANIALRLCMVVNWHTSDYVIRPRMTLYSKSPYIKANTYYAHGFLKKLVM